MKLWLDADAAPRDVKDICLRAAERLRIDVILVANQRVPLPPGHAHATAVRVDGGPDAADRYIADHATAGDVAVTADIPLAALLVPNGVAVIDPRGEEYTRATVGERLSVRNFMDGLRGAGVDTGGHGAYGVREKQAFANALDRALTRALRPPR
ncbi:MAG TPA: YaiI/YqxD family protein [Gemmatirosa sp.]